MKTLNKIALAGVAVTGIGAAVVGAVHADGSDWGGHGHRHGEHSFSHHREGGMRMMERLDANSDGKLTQEEIDEVRAGRFAAHDANNDQNLSLSEFEGLWLETRREHMVDRFQDLDADGDGQVTTDEFAAPFSRMVQHMDRNGDGALDMDDRRLRHDDDHGRRGGHDDDDD